MRSQGKKNKIQYRHLTILFIFYTSLGMAQSFTIPAEGAEWNEADVYLESVMYNHAAIRIECGKDTVINSFGYTALFQTWAATFYHDGPCQFQFLSGPVQLNSYLGAVRTNEERQVLFIAPEDTISYIIYDFSLSIGDTINWTRPDDFEDFKAYVSQIDSIIVEDVFRKRIHLEVFANLPDIWIEGIGSEFGFFSTFGYRSWEKIIHELMCYRDSQISQYTFHGYGGCSTCDIVMSSEGFIYNPGITIYPNPITNEAKIMIPDGMIPIQLRIFDLCGRLVISKSLGGNFPIALNREELKKGILFLEISDENYNLYNSKIIVK